MDEEAKGRIAIYMVCVCFVCLIALGSVFNYGNDLNKYYNSPQELIIDGADFSAGVNTIGSIFKAAMDFGTYVGHCFVVLIFSLIVFGLFRGFQIKKKSITKKEAMFYLYIPLIVALIASLISFTAALRYRELGAAVFINAEWAIIGVLLVFVPALIRAKSHED